MNISESIHEILNREEVVADLFYDIFLDRHAEVRRFFVGVDIRQQAVVLTMTLSLIEDFYRHSYPATARYLRLIGQRHKARGIPRELYPIFSQCLMETLERFHGQNWNAPLSDAWQRGIDKASNVLLEGYQ
jgi:hemoglobin-like flavoprotein